MPTTRPGTTGNAHGASPQLQAATLSFYPPGMPWPELGKVRGLGGQELGRDEGPGGEGTLLPQPGPLGRQPGAGAGHRGHTKCQLSSAVTQTLDMTALSRKGPLSSRFQSFQPTFGQFHCQGPGGRAGWQRGVVEQNAQPTAAKKQRSGARQDHPPSTGLLLLERPEP